MPSSWRKSTISVCSLEYFDLYEELRAVHKFDYHDADFVAKIKSNAANIQHLDSESFLVTASGAVADKEGVLCTVWPGNAFTDKVESRVQVTDMLLCAIILQGIQMGGKRWFVLTEILSQQCLDISSGSYIGK